MFLIAKHKADTFNLLLLLMLLPLLLSLIKCMQRQGEGIWALGRLAAAPDATSTPSPEAAHTSCADASAAATA